MRRARETSFHAIRSARRLSNRIAVSPEQPKLNFGGRKKNPLPAWEVPAADAGGEKPITLEGFAAARPTPSTQASAYHE